MKALDIINIEEKVRLSDSCVWRFQRDYFQEKGPQAFATDVPFYVTCNPFIANVYARIILGYIRDWRQLHPETASEPFYILELGAGSGRFSFYAVKRLCQLIDEMGLKGIQFKYVMSDLSRSDIEFWLFHPALENYVREGVLDFVILDIEADEEIHLTRNGDKKSSVNLVNPPVIIANYLLDSIPQDYFYVDDQGLHETLATVSTNKENVTPRSFRDFEKINFQYTNKRIDDHYYGDEDFDSILRLYKNQLDRKTISFPIVAFKFFKKIMAMSNGKFLLLAADKSYCSMEDLKTCNFPQLIFHGSFSMMVNMHAIGAFFERFNGGYFFPTSRKGIKAALCYAGFKLDNMPNFKYAVNEGLENFTPADYFVTQRQVADGHEKMTYESIVSALALSRWCPHLFKSLNRHLCENAEKADAATIGYFKNRIEEIANNFYFMPNARDTLFDVAIFLHTIREWARAIQYYQKSQHFFGEQYSSSYNLGLCYFECGNLYEAMCHFRKATTLKSDSKEAREWLEYVEKLRAEQMVN